MEYARDCVIVVCGGVGVISLCVVITLIIMLYKKVAVILDSTSETLENVRSTSSLIHDNIASPFNRAQGFFSGMRKAMGIVSSFVGKEEKKDEQ